MKNWKTILMKSLSYILVAALSSVITIALVGGGSLKLVELDRIIQQRFIGDADMDTARDAATAAMVQSIGDRWSYYISAEQYAAYQENKDNAYVGI